MNKHNTHNNFVIYILKNICIYKYVLLYYYCYYCYYLYILNITYTLPITPNIYIRILYKHTYIYTDIVIKFCIVVN